MSAVPNPLVEVRELAKTFDVSAPWLNRVVERKPRQYVHAVDGVSFSIERGKTLALVGVVGAILAGVTAGSGDLGAGVFRELVVTGRSRLAVFAVRIPGGLLFLLPFALAATALAGGAAIVFAGSNPEPGLGLIVRYGAWLVLVFTTLFALALGVGSLLGGRTGVGVVLGWHFAAVPILKAFSDVKPFLLTAALDRFEPGTEATVPSVTRALLVIAAWTLVPLAIGAWRTATRDA